MAPTGEGERYLDVWRVTTWYGGCLEGDNMVWGVLVVHHDMKNACGGDAMTLGAHQTLRTTAFFGLL